MDVYDAVAAAGLALLFAGLWVVAPPLALIVVGASLALFGVVAAGRAARRDVSEDAGQGNS